ncbi:MAG: hypothetical protein ACXU9Z_15200 [Gemmatimonadaceae bacterium]
MKRLIPVLLLLATACNSSSDSTGTKAPPSDISTMTVGEVRVLNPTEIPNGIDLPSGSSARDYVIIVGNTNPTIDAVANFVVKADRSAGGSQDLAASAALNMELHNAVQTMNAAAPRQQVFEAKVRAFERQKLSLRSKSAPVGSTRFSLRRSLQTASTPAVGDVLNLDVPDGSSNDLCANYFQTQAVVASVSRRAILAVDTLDGPPTLLFPQTVLDSITQEFDNNTFVTDSSYFGNPSDIDGNGRVILLFTGEVNKLTPANSNGGFVGGFFFAGDYFPKTGPSGQSCAESNNAEIVYLLSPDPTGRYGNVRSASSVRQGTRGTIPHEVEHMINAGNRFFNPAATAFEDNWLDESLAHIAEEAVGRVSRGFTDIQTLTLQDMLPSGNQAARDDFNAFFFQNFARLAYWMARPDTSSGISSNSDQNLSSSGADWAIGRYVADNYSNGDVRTFTRRLAAGPDNGIKNFTTVAGASLDTLMGGWLVSMYADHLGITGLAGKYQYRSYNFRNVMPAVAGSVFSNGGVYPLQVTPVGSGSDNISAEVKSESGDYFRLTVPANAGSKNVKVLDSSGGDVSYPGAHVYVLRVQ